MYINERILLAYYYKKPPMYDMEIHLESLKRVRLAPILTFSLGFWAIGNRQIFYNMKADKVYDSN
jgi:hypothetical protein